MELVLGASSPHIGRSERTVEPGMLDNTVLRRSITVPTVVVGFFLATVLGPLLLVMAAAFDLVRWIQGRTTWTVTRMVAFVWVYLLGEIWALVALGTVALLPRRRSIAATYLLQGWWAGWNLRALRRLFRMDFTASGLDSIPPGPILVLSRHASLVDSLLPAWFITRHHGITLRYVLKRELLVDPALDIAGNRLPNAFVRRRATSDHEQQILRRLAADLDDRSGVVIFPEGTRYSAAKREAAARSLAGRTGRTAGVGANFRNVLPPRPGGTLTLLDAIDADVVVLAHHGLEGLARLDEIWRGGLVGTRVKAHFWRIPRSKIPSERAARMEWLFDVWQQIDAWVSEQTSACDA